MTPRTYPESKKQSRPRKPRRSFRLPDHYAAAEPECPGQVHPVGLLIEGVPGMAARQQKVARLRQVVRRQVRRQADFARYEDARTDLATRRAHSYYNLGYERGQFAGMAISSTSTETSGPALKAFHRWICLGISSVELPPHKIAAALLDVARATVLALRPPARRPRRH
jgi:hypothetical protein